MSELGTHSRWKSPVAWGAIATLLYMVAEEWFGFEIPGWDNIIATLFAAMIGFGIFNDPTSKNTF